MTFVLYLPLFLLTLWAWCVSTAMFSQLREWLVRRLNQPKVSKGTYLPPASGEAEDYLRFHKISVYPGQETGVKK